MSGGRISYDQAGMDKAISSLRPLADSNSAQTHYNASIRNAIRTSRGQSADKARELNEVVGEIVREYALLKTLTLTLAHNIQNDFRDADRNIANSFRNDFNG